MREQAAYERRIKKPKYWSCAGGSASPMREQVASERCTRKPKYWSTLIGAQLPPKRTRILSYRQNAMLPVLHYPFQLPKFWGPQQLSLVLSGTKFSAGKQAE
jgi:hypothetical protein